MCVSRWVLLRINVAITFGCSIFGWVCMELSIITILIWVQKRFVNLKMRNTRAWSTQDRYSHLVHPNILHKVGLTNQWTIWVQLVITVAREQWKKTTIVAQKFVSFQMQKATGLKYFVLGEKLPLSQKLPYFRETAVSHNVLYYQQLSIIARNTK